MQHPSRVQECVEALCENGCDAVRSAIRAMEQGGAATQTADMTPAEREAVLRELKAIMAIYDQRK